MVLEAYPGHVPASVAQPRTQAEGEQRPGPAEQPTGGRQHQPRPDDHHPATCLRGLGGCGLPVETHPCQETGAAGGGFVDDAVTAVAVVAHRRGVDQDRRPGLGDGPCQYLGRDDAAVVDLLLVGARPPFVADTDPAHVDDGVGTVEGAGLDLAACRIPAPLVGAHRVAANQADHGVVRGTQRRDKCRPDHPRRSGDDDPLVLGFSAHRPTDPGPPRKPPLPDGV
ncbi:Uncharacterised protein [Mycobacteroides abscessus subsp. bolletii]|nr:Uncharacterised protein [Mycobacteroides abscessus subsp. bolletii]